MPERAAVLAAGGRVAIAGDPKDHSTRDLIGPSSSASEPTGEDRPRQALRAGRRDPHAAGGTRAAARLSRGRAQVAGGGARGGGAARAPRPRPRHPGGHPRLAPPAGAGGGGELLVRPACAARALRIAASTSRWTRRASSRAGSSRGSPARPLRVGFGAARCKERLSALFTNRHVIPPPRRHPRGGSEPRAPGRARRRRRRARVPDPATPGRPAPHGRVPGRGGLEAGRSPGGAQSRRGTARETVGAGALRRRGRAARRGGGRPRAAPLGTGRIAPGAPDRARHARRGQRGRAPAAGAAHRPRRADRAPPAHAPDGGRGHRAAAPGRRARHARAGSLRPHQRRAQWPLRPAVPRAAEPRRDHGRAHAGSGSRAAVTLLEGGGTR